MKKKNTILVTRPEPAAQEISAQLKRLGFDICLSPLMEYISLPTEIPRLNRYQALVFTSMAGVHVFERHTPERGMPVFCVGPATADAAHSAGFWDIFCAEGDSEDIVCLIEEKKEDLNLERLLHICGADIAEDMRPALDKLDIALEHSTIYRAELADNLSDEAITALKKGEIKSIPLLSARVAERLVQILQQNDLTDICADIDVPCISARVAEKVSSLTWKSVQIAQQPSLESVIELIHTDHSDNTAAQAL